MPLARRCPDCAIDLLPLVTSEVARLDGSTPSAPGDDALVIDRCPRCQGIWFDAGELERIAGRPFAFHPFDQETERQCPACATPMHAGIIDGAIPVEQCHRCQGVFLDRDDLKSISLNLNPALGAKPKKGFDCARCGKNFPMSEGNLTSRGLVCRACVVNPTIDPPTRNFDVFDQLDARTSPTTRDSGVLTGLISLLSFWVDSDDRDD